MDASRRPRILKSRLELPRLRQMSRRLSTQIVAVAVVAVFAAGLWSSGTPVHAAWLRFYSVAVLIAGGALTGWDRWLWRMPVLQRFQFVPPTVQGTWRGTLTSAWIDPST